MFILKSTEEFKVKGFAYPNFPLLTWSLNNEAQGTCGGDLFFEGLKFLLYYGIKRGRVKSEVSISTYANHLCHFFSFCEDNGIDWREIDSTAEDEMLLAAYRDVSVNDFGLSENTVNQRLRTVIQFYKYALFQKWIKSLPFSLEEVHTRRPSNGFLAHTDRSGNKKTTHDVMLKQKPQQIKFYSLDEVKQILAAIKNPILKLMVRTMLQTGVRKKELLRFPLIAIQPPTGDKAMYRVNITITKGLKAREIDIPAKLMRDLYEYKIELRHQKAERSGVKSDYLFLTTEGEEWAVKSSGLNRALDKLDSPVHVTPHKCRHTYATHTLVALQSKKNTKFEPLIYLRDRLGHASINTTMKYLHLINELMDDLTTKYQDEIDAIN